MTARRGLAAALASALVLLSLSPAWAQGGAESARPAVQALPPAEEVQATEPGQPPANAAPAPATGAPQDHQTLAAPPSGPAADEPSLPSVGASNLPHNLSPLGMFLAADWVVKAVMLGLAFASLVTWTVWLAKSLELMAANRRAKAALAALGASRTLEEARQVLEGAKGPVPAFVEAADAEILYSQDGLSPEGVKERVASHLSRLEAQAGRRLTIGTGLLATIGSTAPFVGLFGTVWGIMNSFIGISNAQTTNLAVVAPGIAEALLATAIGLVAAIPAVVIYNVFARAISGHRALLADAAAAVLRLVSRDLDRIDAPRLSAAAE
ncbi:tonB-system energizer ExbB [Hansschlegelia beijingensis]|uniref:Biopolymer transport protein ExbB n=1 Tax=Hansschlegelia beijingensis TaxID=1133344 RepID=A0A7W6CZK8_9HYPH|nr:tonB-system energizer ExbB [Hansschlegelia beijingensis]MBB3973164.1 biopolymer transport protein ExbB [Hansschlegelia beijingensis]